jgi:hypothetical protein
VFILLSLENGIVQSETACGARRTKTGIYALEQRGAGATKLKGSKKKPPWPGRFR